jgi:hypothetical protein
MKTAKGFSTSWNGETLEVYREDASRPGHSWLVGTVVTYGPRNFYARTALGPKGQFFAAPQAAIDWLSK